MLVFQLSYVILFLVSGTDSKSDELVDRNATEIIRLRGFDAEDHIVKTSDGYNLNVIRSTNPRIKSKNPCKKPILFIHGLSTSAKTFVVNSKNVKPRNFNNINAGCETFEKLEELLLDDPASNSLVFTALNFGHEVWLLNRRSTSYSSLLNPLANKENSSIIENLLDRERRKYWSFSLDDQATYDLPETIEYILQITDSKQLSIVGHSVGGALSLMMLIINPIMERKLSKILLFAPALHLGGEKPDKSLAKDLISYMRYSGPIPPLKFVKFSRKLRAKMCESETAQETICQIPLNLSGPASNKQNINADTSSTSDTSGSGEVAHLMQSIEEGRTHFFDYGNLERNNFAYGGDKPPVYNFSTIRTESISIWWSIDDSVVQPKAIDLVLDDLKETTVEKHFFNDTKLFFNHVSFQIHKNVSRLLVIPALKTLESAL